MGEAIHDVNGIQICAEVSGAEDAAPLLLVMGLGAQLVSWPDELVQRLAGEGFRVIRFDNRDVGRSTHFTQRVDVLAAFAKRGTGEAIDAPYTLVDMAADAAGLLDVLGIDSAHVVGASMGGMIVQQLAIDHPHKVRSVTSIMSTTGDIDVGQPTPEAAVALASPPTTVDEAVALARRGAEIFGSPVHKDPEAVAARARREFNRARNPAGVARQIAAVAASPSRTEALGAVTMPFTVIHGTADTLVTPSGGKRTAEAVPHATYLEIQDMGHDLPAPLWDEIIGAVVATTKRAS